MAATPTSPIAILPISARAATVAGRSRLGRAQAAGGLPVLSRGKRVTADARDRHHAVLEGVPQGLENQTRGPGQLIQEQHAAMPQCAGMSLELILLAQAAEA